MVRTLRLVQVVATQLRRHGREAVSKGTVPASPADTHHCE